MKVSSFLQMLSMLGTVSVRQVVVVAAKSGRPKRLGDNLL